MEYLSPYLLALVAAWFLSHAVKYVIATVRGRQLEFSKQLFLSGGMPSSHVATVVAVWMVILLSDGVSSGLFGLATVMVLIVSYDAVKVRRTVGEQGVALQALAKKSGNNVTAPTVVRGHTPIEVIVGVVFGAVVGLGAYWILQ